MNIARSDSKQAPAERSASGTEHSRNGAPAGRSTRGTERQDFMPREISGKKCYRSKGKFQERNVIDRKGKLACGFESK